MEAMKLAHVEEKFDVFLLSPHKSTSVSLATEVKATHLDSFGRSHNEILDNSGIKNSAHVMALVQESTGNKEANHFVEERMITSV